MFVNSEISADTDIGKNSKAWAKFKSRKAEILHYLTAQTLKSN